MAAPTIPAFKDPYLKSRYPPWSYYYLDYTRLLALLRYPENHGATHDLVDDSITIRPRSVADVAADSVTRIFIEELDDEVDKMALFVIKQQGEIADKFLTLQQSCDKGVFGQMFSSNLYDAAHQLLHLIKFIQANILAIDKLLTVHDRGAPIKVEQLFLSGMIGREKAMRTSRSVERSRLLICYHHEGVNTLVGLAETVYYKWRIYVKSTRNLNRTWSKFHEDNAQEVASKDEDDDEHFKSLSREQSLVKMLPAHNEQVCCETGTAAVENDHHSVFLRIDMALNRLSKSSSFVKSWAGVSGIEMGDPFSIVDDDTDDKTGDAHNVSSNLNLANSFLYMVSYYMVAPTSGQYAERLGLSPSMSGAIIGFTAVSALVSTVLYSWWTSYSYKNALIFSSTCCLVGNFIYAMGLPFDSLTLVLVGRFLNGFGSARAINRRFIADAFSAADRTAASAAFVASGAAGMSFGPALSAVMPLITKDKDNLWWQEENAPAWIVTVLWGVFLAFLMLYFENPPKDEKKIVEMIGKAGNNGETQPLVSNGSAPSSPPSSKEKPLWERPVCLITIFLVFLLKLVLELVLSSAAPITAFYFGWSPSLTGWYLALGNGLVLPAVSLVTYLSRYYQDRQLILFSQVLMLVGSLLVIYYVPKSYPYSLVQYILGTCLLFIAPNTMEGPSMSLLSKNIPKSLTTGIFNLGFFTTEAGFGGRVVADSYLTFCGTWGIERLVNYLYGSLALVNACTLALVYFKFGWLVEPHEHDA